MAPTYIPDFTQANRDAVNKALASGVRQVTFGTKTVLFQNRNDLMAVRRLIKSELAKAAGASNKRRQHRIVTRRGL